MREGTRWSQGSYEEHGRGQSLSPAPSPRPCRSGERGPYCLPGHGTPSPIISTWGTLKRIFPPFTSAPLRALGCCVPWAFIKYCLAEQIFVFLRLLPSCLSWILKPPPLHPHFFTAHFSPVSPGKEKHTPVLTNSLVPQAEHQHSCYFL